VAFKKSSTTDILKKVKTILMEIDDITEKTEEKKVLEKIVEISEEFLQSSGSELNYQKITDDILYISGAKYAVFIVYDEDGSKFRTVAISAPAGVLKKASSLLGFKLIGKKWEHDPVLAEKIKSSTITHFSTLSELTGDFIAKPVVSLLWKTFNIGEVVLVKLIKKNVMLGSFTLIMPANVKFKNDSYAEIYTRQVGLLITRSRSEAKLIESERELKNVFAAVSDPLFLVDQKTGAILDVNDAACRLYGYSRDEMLKLKANDMSAEPDITRKAIKDFTAFVPVRYNKKKDGNVFPVEITASLLELNGRNVITVSIRDITERKKAEEALRASEEKFAKAFHSSPQGLTITTLDNGKLIEVNKSFTDIFGYSREEVIGHTTLEFGMWKNQKDRAKISNILKEEGSVCNEELEVRTKSGDIGTLLVSVELINVAGKVCMLSTFYNITERKNAENKIIDLGYHDQLTGLYNRRFFEEEILRLNTKRQMPLSVVMIDLNSLKLINDTFGHNEGDKILKGTAALLKKICRSDDILARWGGDEFVILLPKTSIKDSEEIAQRIKIECAKLIIQKIPLSLAIGVATKTEAKQDMQSILIDAENNMYKNKLIEKESSASSIISALEQALYEKSNETMEHAFRLKDSAIKLGKSIKLASSQLDELSLLASLHDIGKVSIPEKILLKEGKLTEKEWEVIKRHPEIGFNIARSSPQIVHIAKFILACHENWDGSGYPQGLTGESIPIVSRIMLICDAYDVMTSKRLYKKTMSKEASLKEIKRCSGTQFDPVLVDKFIEILSN
jgi:diguanylate cyclase (GGDEF)-like protein/PAS domain S-box-containing protein